MSLHLVFSRAGYKACMQRKVTDDAVILLADGAYCLNIAEGDNVHILEIDAKVRGISVPSHAAKPIDYADFVVLTEAHNPIVSWAD
jgi:sulfur relay protein TusB/DsrH